MTTIEAYRCLLAQYKEANAALHDLAGSNRTIRRVVEARRERLGRALDYIMRRLER